MGSLKLQSFEDFANASAEAAKMKLEEEQKAARTESAYQFETLLAEFGVTSVRDLNEEDRNKFFAKLGASEVSESLAIIEEGTRSQIGIISKSGKIESVYMHYDGYPDHMLPTIKKGYMNPGTVKMLLKKGGGSFLEADPSKINFYGDKTTMKGDVKNIDKYIKDAEYNGGAEFVYLYDMGSKKWMMADTYDEPRELKPAFEQFKINEAFVPSKGNVKDAKKVNKALEGLMMQASALTADSATHLGAIKYLTMNALEDANFHSYIEPIGKKIGGKIRTVMSKIDGLGGIEVPVGAKTIQKFLDEHYSTLSSAAGWSGIGIVEGVAMYLDGWGFSKVAQAIVDEFNLLFQNESVLTEGNAFLAARAKAIEEDAEEFEFNGKTFPVIKEEVVEEKEEVKEEEVTEDEIEIKVDGDYEIEVEKEEDEEGGDEEAPAEEESEEASEEEVDEIAPAAAALAATALADKLKDDETDESEEVAEEEATNEANNDEKYVVIAFHEKGGGFVMTRPSSKKDAEASARSITKSSDITKQEVVKVSDARKIRGLAGEQYLDESVNEAEVKSDEDFKEYAFSVLQQAFGDKFDEEKAQEVVDGLLDKHGDDYGAAVGALQSSLG